MGIKELAYCDVCEKRNDVVYELFGPDIRFHDELLGCICLRCLKRAVSELEMNTDCDGCTGTLGAHEPGCTRSVNE